MMYWVVVVDNIEIEYIFNNNIDTTLDDILIYILNSKLRGDLEQKT